MIEFIGFSPDSDPTVPGVIRECSRLVPDTRGMVGAPTPVAPIGVPALAAACRGAAVTGATSGTRRMIAGTSTKLYELVAGVWTDRSRVGNYTSGADNRWSIVGFGNAVVAANDNDVIQASTGGAFSDIATAPKARLLCIAPNFVLAFDTLDGTYGDAPDRWWCSAFQDHSNWTPSVTTQATTGRLVGDYGGITAALSLGQQVVAYKDRALYLGSYVGAPVVWQWDRVPGEVGCIGPEAVCDIGGAHIFVGIDNIWMFDGTRPVGIAEGQVREWFFGQMHPLWGYRTICTYEKRTKLVRIYFADNSTTTGQPNRCLVYHVGRRIWGTADETIEAAFNYSSAETSYDMLSSYTYDSLPAVAYDSPYWLSQGQISGIVTGGQIKAMIGPASTATWTTGDFGHDYEASMLRRLRLRFADAEPTVTAQGYTASGAGRTFSLASTATQQDTGLDLRQSGRWHHVKVTATGDFNVLGMVPDLVKAGMR